jgi:fatty-acyl-CoA synthase
MSQSIFEQGLPKTSANHAALSPLTFIERTASVYPDYTAVIHGEVRRDWATTWERCPSTGKIQKFVLREEARNQ